MADGSSAPAKWRAEFNQATDYNSNVTLETSGAPNPAVDEDSLIIDSEFDAYFNHVFNRNWMTGLQASVQNFEHTKNESVIYANDRITYGGNWTTAWHAENSTLKSITLTLSTREKSVILTRQSQKISSLSSLTIS